MCIRAGCYFFNDSICAKSKVKNDLTTNWKQRKIQKKNTQHKTKKSFSRVNCIVQRLIHREEMRKFIVKTTFDDSFAFSLCRPNKFISLKYDNNF